MKNRRILISGAGIAGPTLAYWLGRFGFEPTLVERAPSLRQGGYVIDFWGLGFDVAEKMGLLPALRRDGYEIGELRLIDERGRPAGGLATGIIQSALEDRYVSILRGDLAKLIYESLGGGVRTMFDDSIVAIEQDDDGVRVSFARASPERFDLVIGADGLHSPVRRLVFGPLDRYEKYLGYYAAAFSMSGYRHRDPGAYVGYGAPGRQLFRCALRDDRTVFFFVFASANKLAIGEHDDKAAKSVLREAFGRDAWECPEILNALDGCSDLYLDIVSQIRMATWTSRRIALVGDACFCPSLLAGQGSALAMAGAYILAGELNREGGDHRAAFEAYEKFLGPFLGRKQRAAARFTGSLAPKTRLGLFVRAQAMRLMSAPFVANLMMGRLLFDSLKAPDYER